MKKHVKISRNEVRLLIIELIILVSLFMNIGNYFKIDISIVIVSIISMLIGVFLTIKNKAHIFMPYGLIMNNIFLLAVLSLRSTTDSFDAPIMKFRLFSFFVLFILCSVNYKVYEKIYIG